MTFKYLILCTFLFAACKSKRELLETFPDGSIKKLREYTGPHTWYEREYYVSGDIKIEKVFKSGLQDSIETVYDENGNRRGQAYFRNGLRNGLIRELYSSGQILFEGNCVDGKFEGLSTWYYRNGRIESQVHRHLGKDTGSMLRYDSAGNPLGTDSEK